MTPREIAVTAAKALDSKKGVEIQVIDVGSLTSLADYFVICSGTSNTQINALCDAAEKAVNEGGGEAVIPKDGIPLAELQVGGNNEAFSLVAVGDHLEKQLSGILVEWNKANLVNDQ